MYQSENSFQNGGRYPNNYNEANKNGYYEELERGNGNDVENEVKYNDMARMGFIRKVYGILVTQLVITFGLTLISLFDSYRSFLRSNLSNSLSIIAWIGIFVFSIPWVCCKKVGRSVPINYILLFWFTLCQSYLLQLICTEYDQSLVLIALGLTLGATIAWTVYACTTKTDYSYCGGLLFAILFLMSFGGFLLWIFRAHSVFTSIPWCWLGILLYSFYLIYDTQLILGKFGREYSIDDYVIAAMNVYLDIINLFIYILRILKRK